MTWLASTGVIRYDPPRPGLKRNKNWWAIIKIDREITRYYRWWVKKRYWIDLCQPSWDAHISIIRGEKPDADKMHLWKKYEGKLVKFEYSPVIRQADNKPEFWFIDVRCPMLKTIRDEFGKPSNWRGHITVGRTWD